MRAIVITRPGGPEVLEMQERPTPEPGLGQVRVRVRASALNRADLSQRLGNYPAPPGSPADIPGMEYAGEVDAVGPASTMWPVGTRVMGIIGGGAHAEFVCVHEREVVPIPSELSFEEAAAIPEVFLTAYDALFRQLDVGMGERILVHAIGSGVGTAVLQLALLAGVTVYGTSRSVSKLERAKELVAQLATVDAQKEFVSLLRKVLDPSMAENYLASAEADDAASLSRFGLATNLPATTRAAEAAPQGAAAIRYRRKDQPKGPMEAFGYSWFDERLKAAGLPRPDLLDRAFRHDRASFAYEALNLVNGSRTVQEIHDRLAVSIGSVPLSQVEDYLATLEKLGLLERA